MPSLPETLQYLDCTKNKLTQLPSLPTNLEVLYCEGNPITTIGRLSDDDGFVLMMDITNLSLDSLNNLKTHFEGHPRQMRNKVNQLLYNRAKLYIESKIESRIALRSSVLNENVTREVMKYIGGKKKKRRTNKKKRTTKKRRTTRKKK